MDMYCSYCDRTVRKENAKFCDKCGNASLKPWQEVTQEFENLQDIKDRVEKGQADNDVELLTLD